MTFCSLGAQVSEISGAQVRVWPREKTSTRRGVYNSHRHQQEQQAGNQVSCQLETNCKKCALSKKTQVKTQVMLDWEPLWHVFVKLCSGCIAQCILFFPEYCFKLPMDVNPHSRCNTFP